MSRIIEPKVIEKHIRAWADVTMLSLELKRAMLRKRHSGLGEDEIRKLMRKEILLPEIKQNER
jgi:hypothetical protein